MAWSIEYYAAGVEQAVLGLPDGLLARYLRLSELLSEFGPNLGMPHTRSVGGGLIELRIRGPEGIARAFHCCVVQRRIALTRPGVEPAYHALEPEFSVLRDMLRARQAVGLTQAQVPSVWAPSRRLSRGWNLP